VRVDSSKSDESKITGDGVFKMAHAFRHDKNRFVIVTSNPYNLGLAKAYEACANWKVKRVAVFTRMQEALEALGISA
jgi:hypothetical protein